MKRCNKCGTTIPDDSQRFCPKCGSELTLVESVATSANKSKDKEEHNAPLVGDKNVISGSTFVGKQESYEASNITINNNITEDHSHTTVVCAVSGKRVYMDNSIVCPQCGGTVAPEYYIEATKRCENCERAAENQFRDFAVGMLQGGALNAGTKKQLDLKGEELQLSEKKQTEILRSVQQASTVKESVLSKMQQMDLERAIKRFVQADNDGERNAATEVFELLHNTTQNYVADFWYYLSSAITKAQNYIDNCESELVENFWQRYWAFIAYCHTGSPKSSSAIDQLHKNFAEHEADNHLAEVIYLTTCGFEAHDNSLLKQACGALQQVNGDHLSKPLAFIYEILSEVLQNGVKGELGAYSEEHSFVLKAILHADRYIDYCRQEELKHQAAEQKRLAEMERQRQIAEEQKRQAEAEQRRREQQAREQAERARIAQQQSIAAEQAAKMEKEMQRMGVQSEKNDKAFVGYETTLPRSAQKKMGLGKILLIVLLCIILLIGILFLIPAPESMQ
jgi:rubrerythrin